MAGASVKLDSKLPKIATEFERRSTATIEHIAGVTATIAQRGVPVRTGKTRSTIRVSGKAETGRAALRRRVVVKFPGRLLEYGTKNMRARPFMRPAAEEAYDRLRSEADRWFS